MAHFAKIRNDIVLSVHCIDNKHLVDIDGNESEENGIAYLQRLHNHKEWKQTSYNTRSGVHILGGTPFRKNYASPGYTYDKERDAFVPPKPLISCKLNEETCNWDPIHPMPDDNKNYIWNEFLPGNWREIVHEGDE